MHNWQIIAAFYGAAGVGAGAMASHAIADPHAADMVKIAAIYALIHAVLLACWTQHGTIATAARTALALGVALFSGGIMVKYILGLAVAAVLAPTGGTLLMLAWLLIAISAVSHKICRNQQKTP